MSNYPGASRGRLAAAFAAVYLIWGSTYLAIRFAIETLPPFLMAGIRFVIAGIVLYGWSWLHGAPRPTRHEWRSAAIVGACLLLGGNGGVVWAEQVVPSGLAALLVATVPLWIVAIDWARPGGARPTAGVAAGIVAGFGGVALLVGPGEFAGSGAVHPVGAAVLLGASIAWSVGSLYSRSAPLPSAPFLATGMEMLTGGALLLAAGTVAGEWARLDLSQVSPRSWAALAYLIVFGALVGFTAYIWLLKAAAPAHVATYAYVNPVIAVLLGWALAGEALSPRVALATTVIVVAVALITAARARRAVLIASGGSPDVRPWPHRRTAPTPGAPGD